MKKILLVLMVAIPLNLYAWGDSDNIVKIKTGESEYLITDLDKLELVWNSQKRLAHLGYNSPFLIDGVKKISFTPIRTYNFDTIKQFNKWLKSVRPYKRCLTIDGLVKCD